MCFSPNRSLTVGVLAALKKAGGRCGVPPRPALPQNVAKTIGFTTFSKIKALWPQRRDATEHRLAATATLFSKKL